MQKFYRVYMGLSLLFFSTTIFMLYYTFYPLRSSLNSSSLKNKEETYRALNSFTVVLNEVQKSYHENISPDILVKYAIRGMLKSLDSYSDYFYDGDVKLVDNYISDVLHNIGVYHLNVAGKTPLVKIDKSIPANLGILSGDIVTHINNQSLKNISLSSMNKLHKKIEGKPIVLTIQRLNNEIVKVPLGNSNYDDMQYSIIKDGILYVRISSFYDTTHREIFNIITKNNNPKNITGLILDLRDNGGGLINQAIAIADMFLNEGPITSLVSKLPKESKVFLASKGDILFGKPIVILINENTASSAEILTSALQENKRACVIGTNSFGKSYVQSIIPINKSSSEYIKLTTGYYTTPSGSNLQNRGVIPNIYVAEDISEDIFNSKTNTIVQYSLQVIQQSKKND